RGRRLYGEGGGGNDGPPLRSGQLDVSTSSNASLRLPVTQWRLGTHLRTIARDIAVGVSSGGPGDVGR
ncbi:MAG TPA: hypothetical protein VGD09_12405, partial [Blastococcus sp.]